MGDPSWPGPQQVQLPRLLDGFLTVRGYPLEMVLAEKLSTAIARATANTQSRWAAWLKKQRLEPTVPAEFRSVLEYVGKFADPVIKDEVAGKSWDPAQHSWRS